MCGIAGILWKNSKKERQRFREAAELIKHRGLKDKSNILNDKDPARRMARLVDNDVEAKIENVFANGLIEVMKDSNPFRQYQIKNKIFLNYILCSECYLHGINYLDGLL